MALRYAWLGYAVLPLQAGGKRPHKMLGNRGGVHLAERDRNMIKAWWLQDRSANVGVACGSVSKLVVLDLDVKGGRDGVSAFMEFLEARHLTMPYPDPLARTPSGGAHLYLRTALHEQRVPDRPGILPGVDVKGDGGYVVAYPSALAVQPIDRPGERGSGEVSVPYEWASGCPHDAPLAPGWLLPWLESAAASGTSHPDQGDSGDEVPEEDAALVTGSRNRGIYKLACSLYRRLGTGPDAAWQVREKLKDVWDKTDHYDFPWSEVMVCAESARRFIERQVQAEDARNAQFLAWLGRRNA
jgi:hypothetical protein